jgi:pyruvate dehydrogenase E1 component alpha subunit
MKMATKSNSKANKPITTKDVFTNKFEPFSILNPDGSLNGEAPDLSDEQLIAMHRVMVEARVFDERAVNLQRQGRLGTFAPLAGQEAAQVGSAFALRKTDWLFPSYREHAACALHGQEWLDILKYWGGSEEGSRVGDDVNVFPVAIPIATQIIHATGMAWAAKIQGKDDASLVYFGDGGTSEGDFHEGLNFAGVYKTATVFFCQNNFYAISLPRESQTSSGSIAQKAIGYGIEGIQVDGNDILAVYQVTKDAIERGRAGEGPTLIEAQTYGFQRHLGRQER